MKMLFKLTATVLALGAIMLVPTTTFADGCVKTTKVTEAQNISDKTHCTPADAQTCADKLGMSLEDCQKLCSTGNHSLVSLSITGMTGADCEKAISACLADVPGVKKVGRVSHENGAAFVLIDPEVASDASLQKAILSKGYQAEVVPAVATTMNADDAKAAGCGATVQKACSKKCAATCGAKKTATKEDKSGS